MRKVFVSIVAVCGLLLTSCDKFHVSDNGVLDGFWQLTKVDSLGNGHSTDMLESRVFWAVEANLLEIRDLSSSNHINVFFRFQHIGDQLILSNPVADNRSVSDSIITDVNTLRYYGLSHLTETLKILRLDAEKMTLQSERLRMYFRKY